MALDEDHINDNSGSNNSVSSENEKNSSTKDYNHRQFTPATAANVLMEAAPTEPNAKLLESLTKTSNDELYNVNNRNMNDFSSQGEEKIVNSVSNSLSERASSTQPLQINYADTTKHFYSFKSSIVTPFFGSNEPEPLHLAVKKVHPCKLFSRRVHMCLEQHNNNDSFCQSRIADLYRCLREYKMESVLTKIGN